MRSIIREPLRIQHIGTHHDQDERVSEVLREVGLAPAAGDLYPHEFSGGQRQRIGLARALALHPKLIVADEPVSALDVSIQAQILNLMRSLQERHDLTYIVISHDLAVVKYLANTIGVMYLGKLVEIGPAEELYAHAAHPYTQGLIDTIPVPDPVLAKRQRVAPMRGELPSPMSPPSGCRFRTALPVRPGTLRRRRTRAAPVRDRAPRGMPFSVTNAARGRARISRRGRRCFHLPELVALPALGPLAEEPSRGAAYWVSDVGAARRGCRGGRRR